MIGESDPRLFCIVLKILRALCEFDQKQLASALKMNPKRLSALESGKRKRPPSLELLLRAARAMKAPEGLVDEIFAFVRKAAQAGLSPSAGLDGPLTAITRRATAEVDSVVSEMTKALNREALAAAERQVGDSLWAYYLALPESRRSPAVRSEALFHRWGFAERLWNESLTAAADDHRRALALANLARAAAEGIAGDPVLRSRMEGLAGSGIANARRVGGELLEADEDFARAKELWKAGEAADPGLDEARFLGLEAALRRDQRRFSEALACIQQAKAKARPGSRCEFLIGEANLLLQLQRQEDAALLYLEAIEESGPETPPRFLWVARFNFVDCLCDLDRPEEVKGQFPELRTAAVEIGNGLDLLRVRWLEGRVAAASGQISEAIEILEEARDGFLARGISFQAAVAGLERAALQLELGRTSEVKSDAPGLAEIFKKLGVAPELLASLTLFCGAAQGEMATAEEARHMLVLLRQTGVGLR